MLGAILIRFRQNGRTIIARLALVACSLGLSATLTEIGLRLFGYQPQVSYVTTLGVDRILKPVTGVPYLYRPSTTFTQNWPDNPRGYFNEPDHSLTYYVNNAGYRGRDFQRARTRKFRIALIGDSFGWGNGVRLEHHFVSLLEARLNSSDLCTAGFEFYNFGMGGFNTEDEVALFEHEVLDYKPDICVLWYFLNDTTTLGTMAFTGGNDLLRSYRKWSRLLDLIVAPIDTRLGQARLIDYYRQSHEPGAAGIVTVDRALKRFAELCKREQVVPVLVVHPVLIHLNESYPFKQAHQTVMSIGRTHGIHAVDLLSCFNGHVGQELWVHRVDPHPNEMAHRLVADGFYPELASVIESVLSSRNDHE